ncbi:hypothetical protein GIB67_009334 [Kingdonia uniflora]|uniref:Uncharacterized protein n=1 Tax=Kingdonia uniflora TaxID=39325 RepID=A0A7J7N2S7_9MAGN|nr:hypothetical protein GIB67_009334 [Kingdonia uniflora]
MGLFSTPIRLGSSALLESSCGYLLQELKLIWEEIGQDQLEKEKNLLELEQECLEVYKRKVDKANIFRAHLHQALADAEAEFTHLLVSLGERSLPVWPEKKVGTLKEQLDSITPALQEIQLKKDERVNQFRDIQMKIQKISAEIAGRAELNVDVTVNENDLSLTKLEEYRVKLQRLQKEKSDRVLKVEACMSTVCILSTTLGLDYSKIVAEVYSSLNESRLNQTKNISDDILSKLNRTMEALQEEKKKRLEKIQEHGKALTNLWSLMDTSYEDRQIFSHVIDFLSVSVAEISRTGSLTLDIVQQAEAEVERLDQLKASKMKELFLKKEMELQEICKRTHMEIPSELEMDSIFNFINSGEICHADLTTMDGQISKAKEETLSRMDILEKVEKWISSCDEEHWLEEYDRDENRYSVSRGAHKNLKRAERARITVKKIPALVELLMAMTRGWEEERKKLFLYDEVPLLAMLGEYNLLRQEKEEEKQRQRENKKVQIQVVIGQENLFGSRPGMGNRRLSTRSINGGFGGTRTPLNRRLSIGMQQLGSNSINTRTQGSSFMKDKAKG